MEILIVIFILCCIAAVLQPVVKGWAGEELVSSYLSGLPRNKYRVLNNVMIRTKYGTTQIDHIVVSVYGIFVIETKNYKGWITGSEYGEQWTKNMYGKKYSFRNPIKQNYAHVKAIVEKLGIPKYKIIPIVVFSNKAEIKVKASQSVINLRMLKKTIRRHTKLVFREDELEGIVKAIENSDVTSSVSRKEHVDYIKTHINDDKMKTANGICPRCGGNLVNRNGKYGKFMGCSNFPRCRYTKK